MNISKARKLLCIDFALTLTALINQKASALDVYIVAGQSNGWRIGNLAAEDPAKTDQHEVYYYGMKCVSEPGNSEFTVLKSLSQGRMGYGLAKLTAEQ